MKFLELNLKDRQRNFIKGLINQDDIVAFVPISLSPGENVTEIHMKNYGGVFVVQETPEQILTLIQGN